jgi:hypothetical protein
MTYFNRAFDKAVLMFTNTSKSKRYFLSAIIFLIFVFFQTLIKSDLIEWQSKKTLFTCAEACAGYRLDLIEVNKAGIYDVQVGVEYEKLVELKQWQPLGKGSFQIRENADSRDFLFPVLQGDTWSLFSIPIPDTPCPCKLEFTLINSRAFKLTLNGSLVRSQKYNSRVFGIGPVDGFVSKSQNEVSIRISAENPSTYYLYLNNLIFITIFLFGFSLFFLLKKRKKTQENFEKLISNEKLNSAIFILKTQLVLYGIAILLWALSRRGKDETLWATNTPFMQAGPRFSDFFEIFTAAQDQNPFTFNATNYPSSSIWILHQFKWLNGEFFFAFVAGLSIGFIVWLILQSTSSRIPAFIFLISFPFLFGVDRGNLEFISVILILGAVILAKEYPFVAGVMIGVAASLKLWPILLIVVFFRESNRFKVWSSTLIFFGLSTLGGWLNYGTSPFISFTTGQTQSGLWSINHNYSLSNMVGLGISTLFERDVDSVQEVSNSLWVNVLRITLGAILISICIFERQFYLRLTAFSSFVVLVAPVAFPYRGLVFFLPFMVGLITNVKLERGRAWTFGYAMIFSPTAFYYYPGSAIGLDILFAGTATLVLCGLTIWTSFVQNDTFRFRRERLND